MDFHAIESSLLDAHNKIESSETALKSARTAILSAVAHATDSRDKANEILAAIDGLLEDTPDDADLPALRRKVLKYKADAESKLTFAKACKTALIAVYNGE